jgi:mxaJ protein
VALAAGLASAEARNFRVCADPNNLPFSNAAGEGFENRIAEVVAKDLGATVTYTWWAQRRGFLRNTLNAGLCDVVPGLPVGTELARPTLPLYRSGYAFVQRAEAPAIASLDDPRLKDLRIGVQMVGDNGYNTPPAHALSRRGIVANVRGYSLYGDYSTPHPPSAIVDAVARGEVDVAIVWGPLAGYFAAKQEPPLRVTLVNPPFDGARLPLAFDIAFAVRRDEDEGAFAREIGGAIRRHRAEIDAILASYHVPRLDDPNAPEIR